VGSVQVAARFIAVRGGLSPYNCRRYLYEMRSLTKAAIKRLARRALRLVDRSAFGIDLHDDVRKLCVAWKYRVAVYFDVGANDGDTAIKALSDFPEATVYSFEPHPGAFARLTARIAAPRFKAFPIALGEENNQTKLFTYEDSAYDDSKLSSLVPNAPFIIRYGKEATTIPVSCKTLTNFCAEQEIKHVSVLKIDTEGYDLIVLRGATDLLKNAAIDFIYVEFNDLQPKPGTFGGSLMDIDAFLKPFGHRFVASYNDSVWTEDEMFLSSNALFALPPKRSI
jgi:FkbM family methyltransferase